MPRGIFLFLSFYPLFLFFFNFTVYGSSWFPKAQCLQEPSLKKIIVEGYRAVGSLNDSFPSSNFLSLLLLFFIDLG